MVQTGRLFAFGCAVALGVFSFGVAAQTAGAAGRPGDVPQSVVAAALAGNREGILALTGYLGGGQLPPQEMTRRAVALIQALGGQPSRGEDMSRAIDRIAGFASRLLATTSVLRLAVDNSYRPPADAIALDFGPPDAPTMDGFEKVAPGDPRIAGRDLAGLRRPLDQRLIASGIVGVEKITLRVPPGDYRIVLMTQHLGDPQIMENPFGRSLRINGVPLLIGRSAPQQWLDAAVLSDRGVALTGGRGQTVRGLLAGDLDPSVGRLVAQQQGGALVIDVRAPDGRVAIEMADFGQARTYIAGLLIEPANRPGSLVLSAGARDAVLPLDVRLALEAEILAAAASTLEQIATAAGGDAAADLPPFEAADLVVSGN